MNRKKPISTSNVILLVIILIMSTVLAAMLVREQRKAEEEIIEEAGSAIHADSGNFLTRDGHHFPVKHGLSSILLIGYDSFEHDANRKVEGKNRNRDLADFLVVLVLDHYEKTITPLQLNRDTICEVPWLDERGRVGGWNLEHLTFAHTYGSGREDSCVNTVKAVRKLIYNAPINYYFAFSMDAVPLMNDLVGGVTVTLTEDLKDLGEDYVEGASIRLDGDSALRFLRYRESRGGSNWFRMKRHKQYLYAFADASRVAAESNQDLATDAFKLIDPYLCTDMSVNNISTLIEQLNEYELRDALTPSGDIEPGEEFYEFHVHEDSLWDCVSAAYCGLGAEKTADR